MQGCHYSGCSLFRGGHYSGVDTIQRWTLFRSEYHSGMSLFKGCHYSGVVTIQKWSLFRGGCCSEPKPETKLTRSVSRQSV